MNGDRNARIVKLHVEQAMNLAEIGAMFGITRERVRQIVAKHHGETLTRSRWKQARDAKQAERAARREATTAYRGSLAFFRDRSTVDENGCWIWKLSKFGYGYGHTTRDMGAGYAHRAVWEAVFGPIPEKLLVCHSCDVPACVNPAHLFLGTHSDNVQDSIRKGRRPGGAQKAAA